MLSGTGTPPRSKVLRIRTQRQRRNYWCSPASGRAAVTALGRYYNPPTQLAMARAMRTTSAGTYESGILRGLNAKQSRNNYVYASGLSFSSYKWRVRGGIGRYHAPNLLSVQMARLPWYAGTGIYGYHSVTAYGYKVTSTGFRMNVFDPWDNVRHTTGAQKMFRAAPYRDITW